ncbi:MAG: hypothetical protein N3A55_10325 [Methylohalobius sp.]|nr:hypothetical protein [Methylohalobius sp.]
MKVGLFLTLLGFAAGILAVEIDLSGVGVQRIAPNTIRLRNVNVPGYGNYWGDFVWDPTSNVLRVANAGLDRIPQLTVTMARYTVARNSAPNLTQACMEEFGPASRQADWQDVKGLLGSDNIAIRAFIESNGIVPQDEYLVTYGKSIFDKHGDPYVMATQRNLNRDSIGGNALSVGITYSSTHTGKVVCINPELVGFPR